MFILSMILIVIGFQGSLGKVLACILCPSTVVNDDAKNVHPIEGAAGTGSGDFGMQSGANGQ